MKRQHSAEPLADVSSSRKSPYLKQSDSPSAGTPQSVNSLSANAGTPPADAATQVGLESSDVIGSPYKKQRPSLSGIDEPTFSSLDDGVTSPASNINPHHDLVGQIVKQQSKEMETEEEL